MHSVPGAFQKLQKLYAEGEAAIQAGDLETAVQKFTEGIAIDDHFRQRYVTMYAQRAFALQKLGRLEEAIADYTRALELGEPPTNQAQYHFHRAMCFANLPAEGEERLANVERAIFDHGKSIELYPDHPGPYHLRAKLLVNELERFAEALPDLAKALTMRQLPDLYTVRGFALFNLKRTEEALADFQRAKELGGDGYCDYMEACCLAVLGRPEPMFACMKAALAADPEYREYFLDDEDFAPYRVDPRWAALL
jgi:tetratricopeptide (TPR) repeat protein